MVCDVFDYMMAQLGSDGWNGPRSATNKRVEMYHGGIDAQTETRILDDFPKDDSNIRYACTIGFPF